MAEKTCKDCGETYPEECISAEGYCPGCDPKYHGQAD